jgi:hypothetical protein
MAATIFAATSASANPKCSRQGRMVVGAPSAQVGYAFGFVRYGFA